MRPRFLKIVPLFFLIIFYAAVGISFAKQNLKAQKLANRHYKWGLEYAIQGEYADSKKEFKKALAAYEFLDCLRPCLQVIKDLDSGKIKSETAFYLFESIYYWKYIKDAGAGESAIFDLDMALGREKKYSLIYFVRGRIGSDLGLYDQALEDLDVALIIDPEYPEAYLARGVAYYRNDQPEEAMVDFNHALQMAPRLTDAYVWRGKAYIFKFNKYDQAIADFSKALEIDPLSGEAYLGRAQAYYFKKDLTRSLEDQKKARALGYKTKIEKEIEKAEED